MDKDRVFQQLSIEIETLKTFIEFPVSNQLAYEWHPESQAVFQKAIVADL
jgi:hypothetical protein